MGKIEWTDRSDWNPIRGCTRVSPGCGGPGTQGGCYAEGMAARFSKPGQWGHGFAEMRNGAPRWAGKVELQKDRVALPLSWRKPARVFVSSTSDVFHEALPDKAIDKLFAVMALCPHLTFQVLTKRPERMRQWSLRNSTGGHIFHIASKVDPTGFGARSGAWPRPNIWLGVSAEDQPTADERIPHLLNTPAAVRFVSLEPLLGPIDLTRICILPQKPGSIRAGIHIDALRGLYCESGVIYKGDWDIAGPAPPDTERRKLNWVIVGGESGRNARPMEFRWVLSLRDQCAAADVPFFFKQWGEWIADDGYPGEKHRVGKKAAGRILDGKEHNGFPSPPHEHQVIARTENPVSAIS